MSKSGTKEPQIVSALVARTQFGQIMRRARMDDARFVVGRRGEPQVVIMGIKDYLRNIAPESRVLAAVRAEGKKKRKNRLSMAEIDREIRAFRKQNTGKRI